MLKVMEYRQKIKALKDEGNQLFAKSEAEKRQATADEQKRLDAMNRVVLYSFLNEDLDKNLQPQDIKELEKMNVFKEAENEISEIALRLPVV